jgi:hypothetical protein
MAVRTFRNTNDTTPTGVQPTLAPRRPLIAVPQSVSEESRREEAWRLRAHVAVILCLSLALGIFGLAAG